MTGLNGYKHILIILSAVFLQHFYVFFTTWVLEKQIVCMGGGILSIQILVLFMVHVEQWHIWWYHKFRSFIYFDNLGTDRPLIIFIVGCGLVIFVILFFIILLLITISKY